MRPVMIPKGIPGLKVVIGYNWILDAISMIAKLFDS